jgi:hypothetical protein
LSYLLSDTFDRDRVELDAVFQALGSSIRRQMLDIVAAAPVARSTMWPNTST